MNFNITNLKSDVDYEIYCSSESMNNHVMIISEIKNHMKSIRTQCCRSIIMLQEHPSIQEYTSRRRRLLEDSGSSSLLENSNLIGDNGYVTKGSGGELLTMLPSSHIDFGSNNNNNNNNTNASIIASIFGLSRKFKLKS